VTKTQLLQCIAGIESVYGGVSWYSLRHWDQEIAPNPVKALQALVEEGHLEANPEPHPLGWYRLTAKGKSRSASAK